MNFKLDTKEGMTNAIKWTQDMFNMMNDHGSWGIPRSGTLVHINKQEKVATITVGFMPDPSIRRVIEAMGWTVVEK